MARAALDVRSPMRGDTRGQPSSCIQRGLSPRRCGSAWKRRDSSYSRSQPACRRAFVPQGSVMAKLVASRPQKRSARSQSDARQLRYLESSR
jgi:hypothetical protein